MSNEKAGLGLGLIKFNLNQRQDTLSKLTDLLSVDLDLTENEDFFQKDTLELGFENEAERVVSEAVQDKDISNVEDFNVIFKEVFEQISNQEYFGECDYQFEYLGNGIVYVAYAYGGNSDE